MHLTLILMMLDWDTIAWGGHSGGDLDHVDVFALFLCGFISSVVSAGLGMTRLLMNGPSKLFYKRGHALGGYCQAAFALLMVSNMCVLIAKALWLAFAIGNFGPGSKPLNALIWISVSLAPQFLLALVLLFIKCGCIKTFSILSRWPSYIMMPVFSFFTFSTKRIGNRHFLVCSRKWTWVNLIITFAGLVFGAGFLHFINRNSLGSYLFYEFIYGAAPLFSIAVVNYIVLLNLKSCADCCCGSFIARSGLDIDTFEVVDFEEVQSVFEMQNN